MTKIYAAQIRDRDAVDSVFLVREKTTALAKNGKPYLTLKLMDRSGEIEGRLWDQVEELGGLFGKDDFIQVRGRASLYMGKMQLVVQSLHRMAEEEVELEEFLPVSPRDSGTMKQELSHLVASIRDEHLRALMNAFTEDAAFYRRYCSAPAGKNMHHAYLGGLLEHSLSVACLVDDICARYPQLNRDLLLVGALLHDAGKVQELSFSRSFDYTDIGKLMGHIVLGVEMIEQKAREIPGFPAALSMLLKHMLLSHHGQYEYGSPKLPQTLEAVALNYLDDLDSKINGVLLHMQKEPETEGAWTGYHRFYERNFFRGNRGPETNPVQQDSAAPAPPVPSRPAVSPPAASAGKKIAPGTERPEKQPRRGESLSFSMADQLREKSLDLFSVLEDKE